MQEAETVAELSKDNQTAGRPPFSRTQRVLVLGMLLGLLLFAAVLCPAGISGQGEEYWVFFWLGTWLVPVFFAFFWAAIANRPLAKRVPEGLGLASAFGLAVIWGIHRAQRIESSPLVILFMIAVLPLFLAWPPLWILRKFRGWRLCLEGQDAELPKGRFQFSLMQMFGWMTFLAILLGLASWMAPGQMQNFEELTFENYFSFVLYVVLFLILVAPIFLGIAGLLLSQKPRGKFLLLLFNGMIFGPLLSIYVIMVGNGAGNYFDITSLLMADQDFLLQVFIMEFFILAVSLACMTALRLCGYRLVRVPKAVSSRRSIWRRMGASLAFLSPLRLARRIPPFPALIAAILLAAIALCWPARIIHQANEKVARERAVEAEWEGVSVTQNNGIVSGLGFPGSITPENLKKLEFMRSQNTLVSLAFSCSTLNDEQLKEIAKIKSLRVLILDNTSITDAGLAHLCQLPNLNQLELTNTKITDAGMKEIEKITKLRVLKIGNTSVTDAGIASLGQMMNLVELNLDGTKLTDAGLVHLQSLTLTSLSIAKTAVTDAGIRSLSAIMSLTSLQITNTKITPAGRDSLGKALPNCQIIDANASSPYPNSAPAPTPVSATVQ
jgi:hypothetical protein